MRRTAGWQVWWLRRLASWLGAPSGLVGDAAFYRLAEALRPYIVEAEREGTAKGWDGDCKRRIASARYCREHSGVPRRAVVLALEYTVQTMKG